MTEAHVCMCEQLAQSRYMKVEPTRDLSIESSTRHQHATELYIANYTGINIRYVIRLERRE